MFLMAYGIGKSLTVDILICNTVHRDQKDLLGWEVSVLLVQGCSSQKIFLKYILVLFGQESQAEGIKEK